MKIFIIGILIAINAYPQFIFPEYIQEQREPNRFIRTLISEGTVNNTTIEFFSRTPQLSRGYSWQIELSGCVTCDLVIHIFASNDCITFAEIIAPDALVPVPIIVSDNGPTILNVSNAYYLCSQIGIENRVAEDVVFKATIGVKETF